MSIEPEDLLEGALRADLPSKDTEARLRRRLLGAGLAIGNGVAATTAAAAGGAGVAAKVATLSWGLKVGLAAAVAIPSVGLLWEHRQQPGPIAVAPAVASATSHPSAAVAGPRALPTATVVADSASEPAADSPRARAAPRRDERGVTPGIEAPKRAAPSRTEFAPPELPKPAAASAASTLREETQLLDRAFAELAAGNREGARRLVAEHESRYPSGLLVKERERAKLKISELSRGD
ncbi:MAG: hypothetical protein EOO73_15075 [Myxococcales bacterium]|nr:MAG: hypothetical protein EOO73_15075 [Myxococcales bacterium]